MWLKFAGVVKTALEVAHDLIDCLYFFPFSLKCQLDKDLRVWQLSANWSLSLAFP